MATYINYGEGEEDATVQGAEWLQHIVASQRGDLAEREFFEKFKALHERQEMSRQYDYGPVFDLFVDYSEDLFSVSGPGEKEVESFFALVLSMLQLLEDAQHLDTSTSRLCTLFSASIEQQPDLRLRLLMMLYNTFNNPAYEFRYRVFKHILDYAAKAGLFDQVLPYLDYLDSWMADWDYLEVNDKRTLFADIAGYMRDLGKRADAFLYLKRYAQLFQGETEEVLSEKHVHELTVRLILDALQLPSVIQFDDILTFDAVQALKSTKQSKLVDLCGVFLSGDVSDLRIFHDANVQVFEEHKMNYEELQSKIRLLTLATQVHGKSEIALSDVATALKESEDNVERWVVKALSEGIIDGRIDQLNHTVLVKTAFQRQFGKDEWAFLDGKLTQWIDNLENVLRFISEQKQLREGV